MDIQYHLSPAELIELFEPVFGTSTIIGFPEKELTEAEERLEIKIPAVYRNYLLKYGKCSLNYTQNYLYAPKKLELTYHQNRAYRDSDYDPDDPEWAVDRWFMDDEWKTIINPFGTVFQHPEEEWGQFVKNYLMIWNENQGIWEAGICVDDFGKEDMPVYFPDNFYQYHWKLAYPSIQSFLTWMIYESIECRNTNLLQNQDEIQTYFDTEQIDPVKLMPNPPVFSDEHLSTFYIPAKNIVGFYFHGYSNASNILCIYDLSS